MESIRQKKVSKLLQKELGEWFRENNALLFPGTMVSVTVVRVSPDISIAKVYLSIYPSEKAREIYDSISSKNLFIRKELGQRIRRNIRIVPQLQFFIDDSMDYAQRIDELLKK